jgi:hypothetical protein
MKRIGLAIGLTAALALVACDHVTELDDPNTDDGQTDTASDDGTGTPPPPMDALDIVFVVDDSGSMAEEQAMFATSVFHLINSLTAPRSGWPYAAVDDVRVAVVSSDMGVSADGAIPDEDVTPPSLQGYLSHGDDGSFQGSGADSVTIAGGVIPCEGVAGQCPPGWECGAVDGEDGTFCLAPDGVGTVSCPALDAPFAETTAADPNPSLGVDVACLSSLGTAGCGFEQQLASAARATQRDDQASFFRANAGLGVVIVSDEDDCSMADPAGLFGTEEATDAAKLNVACGEHPEYLHSAAYYRDVFAAAKGGYVESVFLAAIVGVPADDACQGAGNTIGDCLDDEAMQLTSYVDDASGTPLTKYLPACTRAEDGATITSATPGRRFVQLAEEMGDNGYVFSICNEDWIPAMDAFAMILAGAVDEN